MLGVKENSEDLSVPREFLESAKVVAGVDRWYPLGRPRRQSGTCRTVMTEGRWWSSPFEVLTPGP
jgi:hypothetical protein